MTPSALKTLKDRNTFITRTITATQATLDGLTPEKRELWSAKITEALATMEELKKEFTENEEKIFNAEFSGVEAKRGPGRPPRSTAESSESEVFALPGSKAANRETYIASLESAILKDQRAIEEAEVKLEEFRARILAKIEKNQELINQTRAKLGMSFSPSDL